MVNDVTVYLICELLALPGSDTDTTELKSESDVELLLTFVINVCVVSPRTRFFDFQLIFYFPSFSEAAVSQMTLLKAQTGKLDD